MNFGQAMYMLKRGERVARGAWRRGRFIKLYPQPRGIMSHAHGSDGQTPLRWLIYQEDVLAEDWFIVEPVGTFTPETASDHA